MSGFTAGGSPPSPLFWSPTPAGAGSKSGGITATKKVGGAVQRNRAKRLIRAAWREVEPEVPYGWDFIFVARARTTGAKMQQVRAAMAAQLRKLTAPSPKKEKPQEKP